SQVDLAHPAAAQRPANFEVIGEAVPLTQALIVNRTPIQRGRRVGAGRQHPLYFADQRRVPAARPFDKASAIGRGTLQGGFEDFANPLVILRLSNVARLTHSGPSLVAAARQSAKSSTYNSGS